MAIEVDFLPVGDGQRSGDAIAIRFGNLTSNPVQQTVVVIDGGFTDTGEQLIDHVNQFYGTNRVDIAISTHPDADHAAGLEVLVERMDVGALWMHRPWNHTDGIARMFQDGRVTDAGVEARIREALQDAKDLETIANRRRIPIVEPFTGLRDNTGALLVVGPTQRYYESLLPDFRCTPEARARIQQYGALRRLLEGARAVAERVLERWDVETLIDTGDPTSAENNSSVILLVQDDGRNLLFTADAGIPALTNAADTLDIMGITPNGLHFVQVPHHGSRRNVGPTVLDRLIGSRLAAPADLLTAFVSASGDGLPKHPARKVTNAFRRRGAPVSGATGGKIWFHQGNVPNRGWADLAPIPFYNEVDT